MIMGRMNAMTDCTMKQIVETLSNPEVINALKKAGEAIAHLNKIIIKYDLKEKLDLARHRGCFE